MVHLEALVYNEVEVCQRQAIQLTTCDSPGQNVKRVSERTDAYGINPLTVEPSGPKWTLNDPLGTS